MCSSICNYRKLAYLITKYFKYKDRKIFPFIPRQVYLHISSLGQEYLNKNLKYRCLFQFLHIYLEKSLISDTPPMCHPFQNGMKKDAVREKKVMCHTTQIKIKSEVSHTIKYLQPEMHFRANFYNLNNKTLKSPFISSRVFPETFPILQYKKRK